jgi:hypothetical protein
MVAIFIVGLSLTSLLSVPEREVTSPSDFKVVGALVTIPCPDGDSNSKYLWH